MAQAVETSFRDQHAELRKEISKPPAGKTVLVTATANEVLDFKFPLSSVKVVLKDIDVYLVFDDGSQIILPGLGMELSLTPAEPRLVFAEEQAATPDFFAKVGAVETDDSYKARVLESVADTGTVVPEVQDDNPARVVPPTVQASEGSGQPQAPIVLPPPVSTPVQASPLTPSSSPAAHASEAFTSTKSGDGQLIKAVDLAVYTSANSYASDSDGVHKIVHGFGSASGGTPADTVIGKGASYDDFTSTDVLAGSSGNDLIYPEDYSAISAHGMALVSPRVAITVSSADGTSGLLRFSVPPGYLIVPGNGVTRLNDSTYEAAAKVVDGKVISDFMLAYKVPTGESSPDSEGFYDRSTIILQFMSDQSGGKKTEFTTQFLVGVRDVHSQADLTYTPDGSTQTVYALPSTPAPNAVSAGAGNDTIYGGGGDDTLFGNNGNDLLIFDATTFNTSDYANGGVDRDTLRLTSATPNTVVTLTGSQFNTIIDYTETLDFRQANVQVGTAGTAVGFTAADIQGIVNNGNASTLTVLTNAASSGTALQDYVQATASTGVTVSSAVTGVNTTTNTYTQGGNTIAQLILQAS